MQYAVRFLFAPINAVVMGNNPDWNWDQSISNLILLPVVSCLSVLNVQKTFDMQNNNIDS